MKTHTTLLLVSGLLLAGCRGDVLLGADLPGTVAVLAGDAAAGASSSSGGSSDSGASSGGSVDAGGPAAKGPTCAPLPVTVNAQGTSTCRVLVLLPAGTGGGTCRSPGAACDPAQGLYGPSSDPGAFFPQSTADAFCTQYSQAGADPQIRLDQPVCALDQIIPGGSTESCASFTRPGWCVVKEGSCAQAIEFSPGAPPTGAVVAMLCP